METTATLTFVSIFLINSVTLSSHPISLRATSLALVAEEVEIVEAAGAVEAAGTVEAADTAEAVETPDAAVEPRKRLGVL